MPYISEDSRADLGEQIDLDKKYTVGELNYIITRLLHAQRAGSYTEHNALMGVLSCAQAEYYRRKVVPYEEAAILRNGDV